MNATPTRRRHAPRASARLVLGMGAAALAPHRPLLVHLVVTRRCNLSCGYCQEYDSHSPPVPRALLEERIDRLADLETVIVTLTGGETLLHPAVPELVAHVRRRGMTAAINTNGLLLTESTVHALNHAGLYALQLSVDAVRPNAVTKKALKPLWPKLKLLAEHARFRVRVNTVLGAAPEGEAAEVVRGVSDFGFEAKCSLLRRPDGTLAPLSASRRDEYAEISELSGRGLGVLSEQFQDAFVSDGESEWKCRAGARFFHVCENGNVHLCAPRWGAPGTPLEQYTREDVVRAFHAAKRCTARCPVAYAHQASAVDALRPQRRREEAA